jgi:hypothetical protein
MTDDDVYRNAYLKGLRTRLNNLVETMADYSDAELRDIKNTADVFSMKIRLELVSRDARMVDEACALPEIPKTGG